MVYQIAGAYLINGALTLYISVYKTKKNKKNRVIEYFVLNSKHGLVLLTWRDSGMSPT